MTEFNKYGMEDLVTAAISQKPTDFEDAFNDLIVDRLQTAINDKKIQIAQQMYGHIEEVDDLEDSSEEE
jgi:hypothetical protein